MIRIVNISAFAYLRYVEWNPYTYCFIYEVKLNESCEDAFNFLQCLSFSIIEKTPNFEVKIKYSLNKYENNIC